MNLYLKRLAAKKKKKKKIVYIAVLGDKDPEKL